MLEALGLVERQAVEAGRQPTLAARDRVQLGADELLGQRPGQGFGAVPVVETLLGRDVDVAGDTGVHFAQQLGPRLVRAAAHHRRSV
ncbi:MAG: hypothetical protein CAPSK01_004534 [Candidatus Accumulibacter vicinus]|uniref:Uncharacterized protein n=1 Tax=Candidatus Accumulibacter vicinus TaxID=2954382 RepID=A0A084XUM1_9PROT|nr:MAG: hypothetical protein CAPSK01_004534 [Candidatus Accumulibacter vicinus]